MQPPEMQSVAHLLPQLWQVFDGSAKAHTENYVRILGKHENGISQMLLTGTHKAWQDLWATKAVPDGKRVWLAEQKFLLKLTKLYLLHIIKRFYLFIPFKTTALSLWVVECKVLRENFTSEGVWILTVGFGRTWSVHQYHVASMVSPRVIPGQGRSPVTASLNRCMASCRGRWQVLLGMILLGTALLYRSARLL